MFTLFKRPFYVLSNKLRRKKQAVEWMKEKWIADFSKPEKSCFIIKPEIAYNANLEKNTLFLGLKKKNCIAWLETEHRVYVDQVIEAHFHFDHRGGYCAAGIMFRVADSGTGIASDYYLALVSSKGYFRLDAVNNNVPSTLIGWMEIPDFTACEASFGMIALSDHFIFFINGRWIAETYDASIPGGHLGFALASYDSAGDADEEYTCRAWLDYLSVDSRARVVEAEYKKWNNSAAISAENRFRLAESLAALGCFDAAYQQILTTWEQREELAKSVMATLTEMRNKRELLLAARMSFLLGRYEAAEEYINACLTLGGKEPDFLAEKTKILSAQNKYSELAAFLPDYIKLIDTMTDHTVLPSLYALLGHACWNLQNYDEAATAWDKAFSLDKNNGLYAISAAHAFEMIHKNDEALQRYLDGAQCFLHQNDYTELGALVPQLLALGKDSWEAHELAGKWAAGSGDFELAEIELALAHALKRAAQAKTLDETNNEKPVAPSTEPEPEVRQSHKPLPQIKKEKATVKAQPTKVTAAKKSAANSAAKNKAKPAATRKTLIKEPVKKAEKKLAVKPKAKTAAPVKEAKVKSSTTAAKKTTVKTKTRDPKNASGKKSDSTRNKR